MVIILLTGRFRVCELYSLILKTGRAVFKIEYILIYNFCLYNKSRFEEIMRNRPEVKNTEVG